MKILFSLAVLAFAVAMFIGWAMNLVGVFNCDFASPYKCEVIRLGGVVVPPLGGAAGYLNLGE